MAPQQQPPYVQPGEPLNDFLRSFWQRQINAAEQETPDYRHPPLPLARIKKVMKSDPDVKMIAADAPILFCKACEVFIAEITARAFIIADSNKRRTLSRSDIAKALSKSDQFDFLIDIVPRDEMPFPGGSGGGGGAGGTANGPGSSHGGGGKKAMQQQPVAVATKRPGSGDIAVAVAAAAAASGTAAASGAGAGGSGNGAPMNPTPRLNDSQGLSTIPVDPASASGNPEVLNQLESLLGNPGER